MFKLNLKLIFFNYKLRNNLIYYKIYFIILFIYLNII